MARTLITGRGEMTEEIDYGKLNKRVVFTENDHRHVKFLLKLQSIGVTQSKFFRYIITGIIQDNQLLYQFVDNFDFVSKNKRKISKKFREEGKQNITNLGLDNNEIENIFDLIAEEHPEL